MPVPVPETRYAESGDVRIAYQVFGEGPLDIVFAPSLVTHVELQWKIRPWAAFFERLGQLGRVIVFDKRGTGMSDPARPSCATSRASGGCTPWRRWRLDARPAGRFAIVRATAERRWSGSDFRQYGQWRYQRVGALSPGPPGNA